MKSHSLAFYILLSFLEITFAKVTSFRPDDTIQCLANPLQTCDPSRSCTHRTYHPSCLEALVPYTALEHERLSCCFKCCHFHFLEHNKLNINETEFEEYQYLLPKLDLKSLTRSNDLLMSDGLLYQMSHGLKIDHFNSHTKSPILTYASYKITTFKDFNSTTHDGSSRNSKRAIFIDLENECVAREIWSKVATALSGQGVHLTSLLFAKQLPCPPSSPPSPSLASPSRRQLRIIGWSDSSSSTSPQHKGKGKGKGKNKKSKNPYANAHPSHDRPRLNSRGLQHVLSLIPSGVRSSLAASAVNTKGVFGVTHSRPHLMDCSCALQHQSGRDMVKGSVELQKLCSPETSSLTAVKSDIDEFDSTQMSALTTYYQTLTSTKFVLSPADGIIQSHCEWEALAFGAIPVLRAADMRPEVARLYAGLPMHVVHSYEHMDEKFMQQLHVGFLESLRGDMTLSQTGSKYSLSKLFHPHWLALMTNHFTYGKPAQRPWRRVDLAYQKMTLESCAFDRGGKKTNAQNVDSSSPDSVSVSPPPLFNPHDSPHQALLPPRFKHLPARGRQSPPKLKPKPKPLGDKQTHHRRTLHSSLNGSNVLVSSVQSETSERESRVLSGEELELEVELGTSLVELVLPRCCEDGLYEIEWLTQLLSVTEPGALSVSIYYKCLECLPASLAYQWLGERDTMTEADYNRKHNFTTGSQRITLLDDSALVAFGDLRVKQYPLFDRVHNGKEVTAYLRYIIDNHGKTLPKHVVFLHTAPHAHLHFPLLTKFLKYSLTCDQKTTRPVHFMHLNVHYKSGPWGACCGKQGLCRQSTWKYLFDDYPEMGKDYQQASTYSSAQFVTSRAALERWPVSFWNKMLMAINGEHDLEGCPHSSDPNTPRWGGHQLTGQYERMWHIIFGQKKHQASRRQDASLPFTLRLDCMDDSCRSGAL